MHLSKVDMVFRLLSLNQAYVTNSGRVVGIVTRSLLRDYLGGQGKKPTDRCKKFCLDVWHNCFTRIR
jgi:CBS domain-containing protein